jgi:peptide chain release factor subunit 1
LAFVNEQTKVAETAVHCFVGRDDQPNVKGLVVAGSADLKNELVGGKFLDKRLIAKLLKTVDVSYGMEKGLHQAIALATDVLGEVRLLKEQQLLERYFNELVVSVESGKAACGLRETMAGLREGVVDTIICWEQLSVVRYTLQHTLTGQTEIVHYSPKKSGRSAVTEPSVREVIDSHRTTMADPLQWSVVEQVPLVDWLAEHYREFGAQLSFVSGNSELGNQFVQSFGGLGAILRYQIDFEALATPDGEGEEEADEDDDFDDFDTCLVDEVAPQPAASNEHVLEFQEDDFEEDDEDDGEDKKKTTDDDDRGKGKGKEKLDTKKSLLSPIKPTERVFVPRSRLPDASTASTCAH